MQLHDELLDSAGSNWHDWRRFNPDWYSTPYVKRSNGAPEKNPFHVKEYRRCVFERLWRIRKHANRAVLDERFGEMGVVPQWSGSVRSPLEVDVVRKERDGMPVAALMAAAVRRRVQASPCQGHFGDHFLMRFGEQLLTGSPAKSVLMATSIRSLVWREHRWILRCRARSHQVRTRRTHDTSGHTRKRGVAAYDTLLEWSLSPSVE